MPNAPEGGWMVTGQVQTTELGADNRAVTGYRVSFTTGKGAQGSVFVPVNRYTPDNVRAEIAAHAHQLDQVQVMTG